MDVPLLLLLLLLLETRQEVAQGGELMSGREVLTGRCKKAWKELRRQVLERDENACVRCGDTYRLTAHHTSYDRVGTPEEIEDLETLCCMCHHREHHEDRVRGLRTPEARAKLSTAAKRFME